MIRIYLKNGETIVVEKGKGGVFTRNTKNVYSEELVETTLDVKDDLGYSGKTIASFKADEVLGFTADYEEE